MVYELPLSDFWNYWVIGLITVNLVLLVWLVIWSQKIPAGSAQSESDTTGHIYDGLQEYNNPLPRWWLYLFYFTVIFGIGYFILWPGFGNVKGVIEEGGWTQENQWQAEMKQAGKKYGPIINKFATMPVENLIKSEEGMKIGRRLFLNYCSVCHGTDAQGGKNFPNLVDNDWLYGGSFETIQSTILQGRGGVMPPKGGLPLTDEELDDMTNYVLSLSGRKHDEAKANKGQAKFTICGACHMPDGTGMQAMGSPNLTDKIWLHGKSEKAIKHSIAVGFNGKDNRMPSFKEFLGADKVKVVAAYIYSLSQKK